MVIRAHSINSKIFTSEKREFILDNYYPGVVRETKVIVDGELQDFPNDRSYEIKNGSIIEMIIRFSEEMEIERYWGDMRGYDGESWGTNKYFYLKGLSYTKNELRAKYEFNLGNDSVEGVIGYYLIRGLDKAGHSLDNDIGEGGCRDSNGRFIGYWGTYCINLSNFVYIREKDDSTGGDVGGDSIVNNEETYPGDNLINEDSINSEIQRIKATMFIRGEPSGFLSYNIGEVRVSGVYYSNCGLEIVSYKYREIGDSVWYGISGSIKSDTLYGDLFEYRIMGDILVKNDRSYEVRLIVSNGEEEIEGEWDFEVEGPMVSFLYGEPGEVKSDEYVPYGFIFSNTDLNNVSMSYNNNFIDCVVVKEGKEYYRIIGNKINIGIGEKHTIDIYGSADEGSIELIGSWVVSRPEVSIKLSYFGQINLPLENYYQSACGFIWSLSPDNYENRKSLRIKDKYNGSPTSVGIRSDTYGWFWDVYYGSTDYYGVKHTPPHSIGAYHSQGIFNYKNVIKNFYSREPYVVRISGTDNYEIFQKKEGGDEDNNIIDIRKMTLRTNNIAIDSMYKYEITKRNTISKVLRTDSSLIWERCGAGLDSGEQDTLLNYPTLLQIWGNILVITDKMNHYIKFFDKETGDFLFKYGGRSFLQYPECFVFARKDTLAIIYDNGSKILFLDSLFNVIRSEELENHKPFIVTIDTIDTIRYDKFFEINTIGDKYSNCRIYFQRMYKKDSIIYEKDVFFGSYHSKTYRNLLITPFNYKLVPQRLHKMEIRYESFSGIDSVIIKDSIYFEEPGGIMSYYFDISDTSIEMELIGTREETDTFLEIYRPTIRMFEIYTDSMGKSLYEGDFIVDNDIIMGGRFYLGSKNKSYRFTTDLSELVQTYYNGAICNKIKGLDPGKYYMRHAFLVIDTFNYDVNNLITDTIIFAQDSIREVIIPDVFNPEITIQNNEMYYERGLKTYLIEWEVFDHSDIKYNKIYIDYGTGFEYLDSVSGNELWYLVDTDDSDSIRIKIEASDIYNNTGYAESGWMKAMENVSFDMGYFEGRLLISGENRYIGFKSRGRLFINEDNGYESKQSDYGEVESYDIYGKANGIILSYYRKDSIYIYNGTEIKSIQIMNGRLTGNIIIDGKDIIYMTESETADSSIKEIKIMKREIIDINRETEIYSYNDQEGVREICVKEYKDLEIIVCKTARNELLILKDGILYDQLSIEGLIKDIEINWGRIDIILEDEFGERYKYYVLETGEQFDMATTGDNILRLFLNYMYTGVDNVVKRYRIEGFNLIGDRIIDIENILDIQFTNEVFFGYGNILYGADTLGFTKMKVYKDTLLEIYVSDERATGYNNAEHIKIIDEKLISGISSYGEMIIMIPDSVANIEDIKNNVIMRYSSDIGAPVLLRERDKGVVLWTYNGDIYFMEYNNGIFTQVDKLADAVIPDSLQQGEQISGYQSLSGELKNDTIYLCGIYHERSTKPSSQARIAWIFGKYPFGESEKFKFYIIDTLYINNETAPMSPVINVYSRDNSVYIVYEKPDNNNKDILYGYYPVFDSLGEIEGYKKDSIIEGSYPDMYFDGWYMNIVYYNKSNQTINYVNFRKDGKAGLQYVIDSVGYKSKPVILRDQVYYSKDDDIYKAKRNWLTFKYSPIGPIKSREYSESKNVMGVREDLGNKIEYNIYWTEGYGINYIENYIEAIPDIGTIIVYHNGGQDNDYFVTERDSVIIYDTIDIFGSIDYSKNKLLYEIKGIENGDYELITMYYYEDLFEGNTKNGRWEDELRLLKTVNEKNNKEKLVIPYNTKIIDRDTIKIMDGILTLQLSKNSSGPVILSGFLLKELSDSVDIEIMYNNKKGMNKNGTEFLGIRNNIIKDFAIIQFKLSVSMEVGIDIYDLSGRKVKEFKNKKFKKGYNAIVWNGRDKFNQALPSGIYFIVFKTSDKKISKKFIKIR